MKARIALPVLLFVFGLASASNAQDAQFVPADDVFMTEEFKVDLTDKLKEAARENKPAVILFGKPDNPDLGQLYRELQEKSYENRDSLILVIDPDLEGKDSPLRKYIDEELQSKRGLNTAVFPLNIKKDGNLELSQPSFNQWGYRAGIADDITRNVHSMVGASLTPSAATTSTTNPQQSGQLQPNLKRTIAAARQDLETTAATRGLDLKRIKVRMDELEARKTKHSLNDDQIVAAYEAVTRMLTVTATGTNKQFDATQVNTLAELTLHNLARPRSIDQGNHPTCNVTTLEVYMAARHPDIYADLVAQVAISGSYLTSSQERISPPTTALAPGLDEMAFDIDAPPSNKRNHASQLVQMTLVNGVYETGRYHEKQDSKGNKLDRTGWRYIVGPPVKTYFRVGNQWAYSTDEDQLLDENSKPVIGRDGKAVRSPNLIGDDILEASDMVLGYKMPYLDAPYQITGQPWVYDLPTASRLLKFKADGKLPLGVHTMGGIHVQTIHDVVEKNGTCWVLIDNQRGEKDDGWITLDTLHKTQKSMNYQFTPVKQIP